MTPLTGFSWPAGQLHKISFFVVAPARGTHSGRKRRGNCVFFRTPHLGGRFRRFYAVFRHDYFVYFPVIDIFSTFNSAKS